MRRPVLLLVSIAALAAPSAASAANQTLTFDDVPNGTTITNQYQSSYGIVFQRGFTGTQGIAAVAHSSSDPTNYPTQSPPNELDFSTCGFGDFPNCGVELWAKITKPQTTMSLRFGYGLARSTSTATFTLTTYTINQTLIKTYSFPTPAHGPKQLVTLDKRDGAAACPAGNPTCNDNLPPIGYIHIDTSYGSADDYYRGAIDDVTLDTAVSDQGPSIGLTRQGNDTSTVKLVSGGSAVTVPLTVARDGGSTGNVTFSASGLPSGVTATFSPNPYTSAATQTVNMTLSSSAGHAYSNGAFKVTATPASSATASGPVTLQVPLIVQSTYDLQDVGLAIVQTAGPYNLVRIEGRKTIARVTARAAGAEGGQATPVYAQLFGSRGGVPLPGSPLSPDVAPGVALDQSGQVQTYDPKAGFTFTLPASWDSGSVDFKTQVFDADPVNPGFVDTRHQVECGGCGGDNTSYAGITFRKTKPIDISPVQITWSRNGATNTPGDVGSLTDAARQTSPVSDANWGMRAYQGVVDVTDIAALGSKDGDDEKNGKVWGALSTWEYNQFKAQGNKDNYGFFTMGINASIARGLSANYQVTTKKGTVLVSKPMAVVDLNRPLSSVAHELGHAFGRLHADHTCGGQTKDAGGSDPNWPNTDGKFDDGFGVDTRTVVPGTAAVYPLFDPTKTYDFMSYCGTDSNEWISERGWNQAYGATAATGRALARTVGRSSAVATQAGSVGDDPSLLVTGFQVDGEKTYLNAPQPTTGSPGTQANSPFTAQAVDTHGDTIATTKLTVSHGHADPGDGQPAASMSMLFGAVPTEGKKVGSLVLRNRGKVIARKKASRHAPKVRVRTPKIPAKGAAPKTVTIHWKATDRDHDKLKAIVSYSTNGKRYRVVFMGPNRNKVTLPASLLAAAKHARVRVQVTDGFHTARSTSKRFRSRGAAPVVHFASPDPGTRIDAAAHLYLDGLAYDDAGYRLRSRSALRWYVGSRLIARGPVASVTGLRPGRHVLRLVARDRLGRTRTARRVVHILG